MRKPSNQAQELKRAIFAEDERTRKAYEDMHKEIIISHFLKAQRDYIMSSSFELPSMQGALAKIGVDTDTVSSRVKTIPLSDKYEIYAVYIKSFEDCDYRFLAVWDNKLKIFHW